MKKIGRARAVGKIILMGEHAVVYGQPAISIPFPTALTEVRIEEDFGDVRIDCDFYQGYLKDSQEELEGIRTMIERMVADLGQELRNFSIDIRTSIPIERGMGSSAAVAVAITRAIYNFFGREASQEDLLKYSDISEKIIHGNPSGLDAATIIGERSLYYIRGEAFQPFDFSLDAYLIVADSGKIGNTREAVASVARLMEEDQERTQALIGGLGLLAEDSRSYLEANDRVALGRAMTEAQAKLKSLGVSDTGLDSLVARALEEGALGAKLTGGGRGGSMIALAGDLEKAEKIAQALIDQGARETWIASLGDGRNA